MGVITKGEITLSSVNDAYTVSLTNGSCVISADFDGSNPRLDDAYTYITVKRGSAAVQFLCKFASKTSEEIEYALPLGGDETAVSQCMVRLTAIPSDTLGGNITFDIETLDGFTTQASFAYNVVREAGMLDWIKDWESNKTSIGDTYLITPKIFVGKKVTATEEGAVDTTALTGVYIGPDGDFGESAGIYGYKEGEEIFHINETGGSIGGWNIYNGGIQSKDGLLQILSDGSIKAVDTDGAVIWWVTSEGEAAFARGNVQFHADGSAIFNGSITSTSGNIGGWSIIQNQLNNGRVILSSSEGAIGVCASISMANAATGETALKPSVRYGGVMMYYTSATDFGFVGYTPNGVLPGKKIISIGSENYIAGWNIETDAIYIGTKNNTLSGYTTDGITLGTNGLRGLAWYIDNTGDISFMNGMIQFTASDNGGNIVGWKLNSHRFSTDNAALVSESSYEGLYFAAGTEANFNSRSSADLATYIEASGGVYLATNGSNSVLAAYDTSGNKLFKIQGDGASSIAGWNFNGAALYSGEYAATIAGTLANDGEITIAPTGIRSHRWRFESNGSGAIAGGNIYWDESGNLTFVGSKITFSSDSGQTILDSNGVFTGKLNADNIVAGTIDATKINVDVIIANGDAWALNKDGSGYLANGNITWDAEGLLELSGTVTANAGKIGGFIIKDNMLISQNGMMGTMASTLYDNEAFVPNITVNGLDGTITTCNGIVIDGNGGINLYNDSNELVARITNSSIGSEVDLEAEKGWFIPISAGFQINGTDGTDDTATVIDRTISIGYLCEGSTINLTNAAIEMVLPESDATYNATFSYGTVKWNVRILRDSEVAWEQKGQNSGYNPGDTFTGGVAPNLAIVIGQNNHHAGYYVLQVTVTVDYSITGVGYTTASSCDVNLSGEYFRAGLRKTLIGTDGMYSCWGGGKYFFASADGIKMRQGNYLLQVTDTGIKKSTNGGSSWETI